MYPLSLSKLTTLSAIVDLPAPGLKYAQRYPREGMMIDKEMYLQLVDVLVDESYVCRYFKNSVITHRPNITNIDISSLIISFLIIYNLLLYAVPSSLLLQQSTTISTS